MLHLGWVVSEVLTFPGIERNTLSRRLDLVHLAIADAMARFIDLGPSAYGEVENDSISEEDLDVTAWFEGRAPSCHGQGPLVIERPTSR